MFAQKLWSLKGGSILSLTHHKVNLLSLSWIKLVFGIAVGEIVSQ